MIRSASCLPGLVASGPVPDGLSVRSASPQISGSICPPRSLPASVASGPVPDGLSARSAPPQIKGSICPPTSLPAFVASGPVPDGLSVRTPTSALGEPTSPVPDGGLK